MMDLFSNSDRKSGQKYQKRRSHHIGANWVQGGCKKNSDSRPSRSKIQVLIIYFNMIYKMNPTFIYILLWLLVF